jgi:hypothetical protein
MRIQYTCPIDPDVVLFEDDMFHVKMFVPDRIETCPKCGRSYFKEDCIETMPDIEVSDDED